MSRGHLGRNRLFMARNLCGLCGCHRHYCDCGGDDT